MVAVAGATWATRANGEDDGEDVAVAVDVVAVDVTGDDVELVDAELVALGDAEGATTDVVVLEVPELGVGDGVAAPAVAVRAKKVPESTTPVRAA